MANEFFGVESERDRMKRKARVEESKVYLRNMLGSDIFNAMPDSDRSNLLAQVQLVVDRYLALAWKRQPVTTQAPVKPGLFYRALDGSEHYLSVESMPGYTLEVFVSAALQDLYDAADVADALRQRDRRDQRNQRDQRERRVQSHIKADHATAAAGRESTWSTRSNARATTAPTAGTAPSVPLYERRWRCGASSVGTPPLPLACPVHGESCSPTHTNPV